MSVMQDRVYNGTWLYITESHDIFSSNNDGAVIRQSSVNIEPYLVGVHIHIHNFWSLRLRIQLRPFIREDNDKFVMLN